MGNWTKVVILLIVVSLGVAFGGYMFYRSSYKKPRVDLAQKKEELRQQIENGKKASDMMTQRSTALETLYTRSFPLNSTQAGLEYQMWLTQMLEFCNIRDAQVVVGKYSHPRNSGTATQMFRVAGRCALIDLTQFLYEFYWTPFLHRISVMDVTPVENSNLLDVTLTIEGLTILYKENPNQAFPLKDKLPLSTNPPQQLASGPFAAYESLGDLEIFRAVKSGVDAASFAVLTGTPSFTDENGETVTYSRWNLGTEGRTISLKVGERMKVGAFDATVVDVSDWIVVLKQNTGRLWAVQRGHKLSEAVAVPNNLF